jgi:hypothetical protein
MLYVALLLIRPQEWVTWMHGFPILDFVVAGAVITWLGSVKKEGLLSAPQNLLMLGLFLAVLMSHARHTFLSFLVRDFRDFGKIVIVYFLVATAVDSVRRFRWLVFMLVIGALFMSWHGILQAHSADHTGFGGATALVQRELVRVRGFGLFHDPNDLALMLVAVLPFLFSIATNRRENVPWRLLCALGMVPLLYCIYLTNSRGGWLALGVAVVTYVFLLLRNRKVALALAVGAVIVVFLFAPSRIRTISADEGAARGRLMAWGTGNRLLKRYPIFGLGAHRFTEFSSEGRSAHNSFLLAWAEMGLFGYFFWLGMAMACSKDAWALSQVDGRDSPRRRAPPGTDPRGGGGHGKEADVRQLRRFGVASLSGLMGFYAAAFFLSRTYVEPLFVMLAMVVALRLIYERAQGPLEHRFTLSDSKYVLAAELVSVPALWLLIRIVL